MATPIGRATLSVKGAFFLRRNDDAFTGITQKTCTIVVE